MLKQKLKLGFIGGGLNSAIGRVHWSATAIDSLFEVTCGIFSRNKDVNRKTAEYYGLTKNRAYNEIDVMLSEQKLDAIVVMTPSPDHFKTISKVLNKGPKLICEKPVVTSLAEWHILNKVIENSNDVFAIYNYTGYPMVREARSIIGSGKLGKVQQVLVEMPNEGLVRPPKIAGKKSPPQSWRLKDDVIPQATLDLTTHAIQLSRFITQLEITSAQGQFSSHSKYNHLKDTTQIMGMLDNMASFSIWTSKSAIGCRNGLEIRIFLEKGSLRWVQTDPEKLYLTNYKGREQILDRSDSAHEACKQRYDRFKVGHPAGFIEAFANYYYDLYQEIGNPNNKKSKEFLFNMNDSYEELVVLESLIKGGRFEKRNYDGRIQKLHLAVSQ